MPMVMRVATGRCRVFGRWYGEVRV
jgi:hypothetical protein